MSLAQLREVSVSFAAQKVLDGISASINESDRIGLIGANGTGKTTLLRLIAGVLEPDTGRVSVKRGLRVGFLEQEPILTGEANVHDVALSAFADLMAIEERMRQVEHEIAAADADRRGRLLHRLGDLQSRFEHAGGYEHESRAAAVLMGLGFGEEMFTRPVAVLSGGEKSRLTLARLLLREAELLLLDEPTNHLDLDGIEWLEDFLNKKYRGAVVLVAHDRTFLDRAVTKVFELEDARLTEYPGNYSKYVTLKEQRRLEQQRAYDKQREFIEKEEEFYRRYHAAQRSKEAKGRMKRLSRLERIEAPKTRKEVKVRFISRRDPSELCMRVEGLSKRYDSQTLFRGLDIELCRGERIGIIGPNGSGKTSLLRALLGEVAPDSGTIALGRNVAMAYLPQEPQDTGSARTVLDEVWERRRTLDEVEVRSILGRFLFSGDDDVNKRLADLSGGERKRVSLACLMVERPNLLLLDEPTNHLDIPSRSALESALTGYEGTVIAVSHDRYFLNRIVRKLIVLDSEETRVVYGTYDDYEHMKTQAQKAPPAPVSEKPGVRPRSRRKFSKNRLARLEKKIATLEAEKEALEKALAEPALYSDPDQAQALPQRYKEVGEKLEAAYALWTKREG